MSASSDCAWRTCTLPCRRFEIMEKDSEWCCRITKATVIPLRARRNEVRQTWACLHIECIWSTMIWVLFEEVRLPPMEMHIELALFQSSAAIGMDNTIISNYAVVRAEFPVHSKEAWQSASGWWIIGVGDLCDIRWRQQGWMAGIHFFPILLRTGPHLSYFGAEIVFSYIWGAPAKQYCRDCLATWRDSS